MTDKLSEIEKRLDEMKENKEKSQYRKNSPVKRFFGKLFLYSALFGGIAYLGDINNVKRWADNHIRYANCPKSSETVENLDDYDLEIRVKNDQKALYLVNKKNNIERIVRPEGYVGGKGEDLKNKLEGIKKEFRELYDKLEDRLKDFGADMYKKFN
ncbi:hypothetical protein JW949_00460 [Candidatus Woesearchaeota archaeon]|nr:hypothetical protein [Candidatus Woesearchaeota archaeon]